MTALVFGLVALGSFLVGLSVGYRKVGTLRADVATWRALAEELHAENSRLRLGTLSWTRRQS